MTSVFFVRHAQPDGSWPEDRSKPLTAIGMQERKKVISALANIRIDAFISSPYKRSMDTIAECAEARQMCIQTDERFRERQTGLKGYSSIEIIEKRWKDFDFCEDGGESLNSVQRRNIEALKEVLRSFADKNIVIGTHGTALCTVLNYYDASFTCEGFVRIWHSMPYIIRLDFENDRYIDREELLNIESSH